MNKEFTNEELIEIIVKLFSILEIIKIFGTARLVD